MRINLRLWLAVLGMVIGLGIPAQAQNGLQSGDEFETLMQKIRQDFVANPAIDEALAKYNEQDGSFTDVDYASIQRTNWPPLVHVERISDFVFAYTNPKNKHFGEEALYDKIVKGLEFWHERNPWCHNWWYNQISEPQKLGVLLIQMRTGKKQLPADLEKKILDRVREDGGDPAKWTGANRTDIALHWIYRSCLQRNAEDLAYALENVYNPVVYTTKEGFQHDNSNFQHGQQLYIGGYGDEILKGVTQVAMYTRGTRFAMPQDKLELISKFMRETYYAVMRGKYCRMTYWDAVSAVRIFWTNHVLFCLPSVWWSWIRSMPMSSATLWHVWKERKHRVMVCNRSIPIISVVTILCMSVRSMHLTYVWYRPVQPAVSMVMEKI